MDPSTLTLIGISIGLLIALSALFSGMETAVLSVSEVRLRARMEAGERLPRLVRGWLEEPYRVLTTLLIGNNAVNITASALATSLAEELLSQAGHGGWGIPVAVGAMTLLILMFGEVVPKSYAKHHPEQYLRLVPFISPFYRLCEFGAPILLKITRLVVKQVGGDLADLSKPVVTEEDIEEMVQVGIADGSIDPEDARLLTGVLELDEKVSREIMVPRTDVHALAVDATVGELVAELERSGFSRYPIYRGSIDDIVGVLYVKDVLPELHRAQPGDEVSLEALMRPPIVYPENIPVSDLLVEMKRERVHLAVIASEYGGVAGIVSLEDIVEEVFGDIYDEHDLEAEAMRLVGESEWLVEGVVTISDLSDELGVELDDEDEDYETVAGLLMRVAGRVPEPGFTHSVKGVQFEVKRSDATRLLEVAVRCHGGQPADGAGSVETSTAPPR